MVKAFRMNVFEGFELEYQKRHDEIWADLKKLLKEYGISNYRIFLDKENLALFAFFEVDDEARLENLPQEEVMKRWWAFMSDIMPTNADNSPKTYDLKEVFYLA